MGHHVSTEVPNRGLQILSDITNRFRYDLVLVDYHYTNSDEYGIVNGSEFCQKLVQYNLCTPLVLFTEIGNDFLVAREVLGDHGICYFFSKDDFRGDLKGNLAHISKLPGFKRLFSIRNYEIEDGLKKFFRDVSMPLYLQFMEEAKKEKNPNWTDPTFNVILNQGYYSLPELLGEIDAAPDISKISKFIYEILQGVKRIVKFTGEWNDKYQYRKDGEIIFKESAILREYKKYQTLSAENYKKKRQEIDHKALDYLINVLIVRERINNHKKNDSELDSALSAKNAVIRVTESCASKYPTTRFMFKMIGRRVVFGMQKITDNFSFIDNKRSEESFRKVYLAALLRDGNAEKAFGFNPATVFSTQLGLEVDDSSKGRHGKEMCFLLEDEGNGDKYIMDEEEEWVAKYAETAIYFKKFIEDQYDRYEKTMPTLLATPVDLSDFRNYIANRSNLKSQFYEDYRKELLKMVKNTHSERYEIVFNEIFS